MKPRQIAMAVALAGAAGLLLFGDRAPPSELAEAVERSAPATRNAQRTTEAVPEAAMLRLQPRALLIGETGEGAFAGRDGVFLGQNWNPPPAPPSTAPAPPPPSAPPLPFSYIGKAAADGAWEVFLARADRTYVVRNQTVIDGVYRVDTIAPPMLTMTYLPLNQVQQLNIGVSD